MFSNAVTQPLHPRRLALEAHAFTKICRRSCWSTDGCHARRRPGRRLLPAERSAPHGAHRSRWAALRIAGTPPPGVASAAWGQAHSPCVAAEAASPQTRPHTPVHSSPSQHPAPPRQMCFGKPHNMYLAPQCFQRYLQLCFQRDALATHSSKMMETSYPTLLYSAFAPAACSVPACFGADLLVGSRRRVGLVGRIPSLELLGLAISCLLLGLQPAILVALVAGGDVRTVSYTAPNHPLRKCLAPPSLSSFSNVSSVKQCQ